MLFNMGLQRMLVTISKAVGWNLVVIVKWGERARYNADSLLVGVKLLS